MAVKTLQDLLDNGVNAFAIRLMAKDFEKMKVDSPMDDQVHVAVPVQDGKVIWVTFSSTPPDGAPERFREPGFSPGA